MALLLRTGKVLPDCPKRIRLIPRAAEFYTVLQCIGCAGILSSTCGLRFLSGLRLPSGITMIEYKFHPACLMLPTMQAEEFESIRISIATGYNENYPILLCEGKILDGRHRYLACLEQAIEPTFEEWTGGDPYDFIRREHQTRRKWLNGEQKYLTIKNLMEASDEWLVRNSKARDEARAAHIAQTEEGQASCDPLAGDTTVLEEGNAPEAVGFVAVDDAVPGGDIGAAITSAVAEAGHADQPESAGVSVGVIPCVSATEVAGLTSLVTSDLVQVGDVVPTTLAAGEGATDGESQPRLSPVARALAEARKRAAANQPTQEVVHAASPPSTALSAVPAAHPLVSSGHLTSALTEERYRVIMREEIQSALLGPLRDMLTEGLARYKEVHTMPTTRVLGNAERADRPPRTAPAPLWTSAPVDFSYLQPVQPESRFDRHRQGLESLVNLDPPKKTGEGEG